MDAMEFFRQSSGKWQSQRTTHHLPFRRAESGGSKIYVETLPPDAPKVLEICELHSVEPSGAVGGAFISWDGSMDWDKEEENHQGATVFVLVPQADNPAQGILLRERGYAEIVPVAGHYYMDQENALILITEYETMSIFEKFWFVDPDTRLRMSTVKRFGGFNTATFCIEIRTKEETSESLNAEIPVTYALSGW